MAFWKGDTAGMNLPAGVAGEWLFPPQQTGAGAANGLTLAADTVYLLPFTLGRPTLIDQMQFKVDTLEAAKSATCGIYTDEDGRPGDLLAATASGSLAVAEDVEVAFSSSILLPVKFWVAIQSDATGTAKLSDLRNTVQMQAMPHNGALTGTTSTYTGLDAASAPTYAAGSLPSKANIGALTLHSNSPIIRLRIA